MRTPAIIRMILLVISNILAFPLAGKAEPPCDNPPYGAELLHYQGFMRIFMSGDAPNTAALLHDKLAQACEAKFRPNKFGKRNWERESWYPLGFTDDEIENSDVTDLAVNRARRLQGK
jgi:hypothetical protein